LLILINGSNFLDGINTLVCGYYILIILVILYISHNNVINSNFLELYYLLPCLLVIFSFNFFSKTYLGDSGTFLLSLLVGHYLINLCNNTRSQKYKIFLVIQSMFPSKKKSKSKNKRIKVVLVPFLARPCAFSCLLLCLFLHALVPFLACPCAISCLPLCLFLPAFVPFLWLPGGVLLGTATTVAVPSIFTSILQCDRLVHNSILFS
jgi:hypothetical protein